MNLNRLKKQIQQIELSEHLRSCDLNKKRISQSQMLLLLDISRNTLKEWRNKKLISRTKRHNEWAYAYKDIIRFLERTEEVVA